MAAPIIGALGSRFGGITREEMASAVLSQYVRYVNAEQTPLWGWQHCTDKEARMKMCHMCVLLDLQNRLKPTCMDGGCCIISLKDYKKYVF